MNELLLPGEPFDAVLDVGGNVGEFAELAVTRWPGARVVSFEPIPQLAKVNRLRAGERWDVVTAAISRQDGWANLYVCENQHSASTMQEPGTARRREFGLVDQWQPLRVPTHTLDFHLPELAGRNRLLVKIDVEGHEGDVLAGAAGVLELATTVIVEVQNDPAVFVDAPEVWVVDTMLRERGLQFCGLTGVLQGRTGRVLQFDGVWTREPWRTTTTD